MSGDTLGVLTNSSPVSLSPAILGAATGHVAIELLVDANEI